MHKQKVKFDKPIYVGFSVLDLSKLLIGLTMINLKTNDTDLYLLYVDTDSYFVEMRKNCYKVIKDCSEEFDTSDYDKECEYYDLTNKKVIPKFVDKLNRVPLEEYCGLR